jgi:dihydropteroate synthase
VLTLEYLAALHQAHADASRAHVKEFTLGTTQFQFNARPSVMGVINLSPDSWYRESVCLSVEQAIQRGRVLAAQGVDIVDVGAESTLAHAARRTPGEQLGRLLPVIEGLRAARVPVSVETYDLSVAEHCLKAGASVLNLTGTEQAEPIYALAAEYGAAVIICYVQGKDVRQVGDYEFAADPVGAMHDYFARAIELALGRGVDKLLIDPGLGFYYRNLQDSATRVRFQMQVFLNSFRLRTLGYPVCQALPHAFEYFGQEVRSAEAFFAVLAAIGGTDLFRTHEAPRVKAVLDTLAQFAPSVHADG